MNSTHSPNPCEQALEWLALDLGGDATPDELEQLQRHLEDCAECREEADALAESHRVFLEHAPPPPTEHELGILRTAVTKTTVAKKVATPRPALRRRLGSRPVQWLALAAALWLAVTLALRWSQPPESLEETLVAARTTVPAPGAADASTSDFPVADPQEDDRHATDSAGGERPTADPTRVDPEVGPGAEPSPIQVAESRPPRETDGPTQTAIPELAPPPTTPPGPRGFTAPPVAVASLDSGTSSAPFTLKLVSDEPDLVIYWLVDPSENPNPQESSDATAL